MVTYIRSDLDFILAQIKIAEAHAAGQPLFGPGGLVPAYNLAWGLRTVDGTYNNLLPGQEQWGAADKQFPELARPEVPARDGTISDPAGPSGPMPIPTSPAYNPSNNPDSLVFDSSLRTISNLLVDQTLGNPAAILTALQRAGVGRPDGRPGCGHGHLPGLQAGLRRRIPGARRDAERQAAADELGDGDPLTPADAGRAGRPRRAGSRHRRTRRLRSPTWKRRARCATPLLEPFGIAMDGDNVHLPNIAPDEGLSASFNSWFTLFGQFFDHGLDLVNKGGSGTVFIPLQPDDPLYVAGSHTNFMVLTRATVSAGTDGIMGTRTDDVRPVNTTTSFVDQNQTYTSHSSHQVFLRQYELNADGRPVATGKLIEGGNGGMATWGEVKAQARTCSASS